jgi:hypothetical protein
MATLIRPDGSTMEVSPKGRYFTLKELYALVCPGDDFPIVQAVPLSTEKVLWCHEEGRNRGLAPNIKATDLYGNELLPGDVLVGNILITSIDEVD